MEGIDNLIEIIGSIIVLATNFAGAVGCFYLLDLFIARVFKIDTLELIEIFTNSPFLLVRWLSGLILIFGIFFLFVLFALSIQFLLNYIGLLLLK